MLKKTIRPEIHAIQSRFFEALDLLINTGQCVGGLKAFCKEHDLNRVKYYNIRIEMRKPDETKETNYRVIDLDALTYLCMDFNISPDWLLMNKGTMFKRRCTSDEA